MRGLLRACQFQLNKYGATNFIIVKNVDQSNWVQITFYNWADWFDVVYVESVKSRHLNFWRKKRRQWETEKEKEREEREKGVETLSRSFVQITRICSILLFFIHLASYLNGNFLYFKEINSGFSLFSPNFYKINLNIALFLYICLFMVVWFSIYLYVLVLILGVCVYQ